MPLSPEARRAQAYVGVAGRRHKDDPAVIERARQEFKAVKAADYITELVSTAPPLSTEQLGRLVGLLGDAPRE